MQVADFETLTPTEILGDLNDVEAKFAPRQLFIRGDRDLLTRGPRVSIVGSREASPMGLKRSAMLSKALCRRGIVVVSGLAAGVDRAAHEAALEAGGETIAVLGTPLDQFFPKDNRSLQERIGAEQLLVSQFPTGYPVTARNFPIRNRTMALLTDATVIVEAGERSGTLHQGWEALRLGRLLFLMESVVCDRSLTWPAKMIAYGAQVLTRENLGVAVKNIPAFTSSSRGAHQT
jgi:DNA processing protein